MESYNIFEKNFHLDLIVDRSNIIKIIFYYILLFLGVTFIVPSQCFFPKLKLHVIKKVVK